MTTVSTCASIANVTREHPVKAVPGSLAVREILAFDLLADARVLAGASGLERRVHRLNMMTVPDIVRWTKDHELLLTTGYPLPNAPGELIRLFTALDERGVAAVGVKYGSYGPGLMPEVLQHADGLGLKAAAGGLGRDLVAVCGVGDGPAPTARLVAEGVKDATRRSFSVGASSVVTEPHALPTGYQQARTALDIAQKTRGAGAVMPYEALGLYRLLNAVSDRSELQAFVDEVLRDVLARPMDERTDLLRTLDVLLANQLNVAESARILHFHYNTMRYRITKLRKLVGSFTTDSQLCLRLSVALEILHMWEMSDTVGS